MHRGEGAKPKVSMYVANFGLIPMMWESQTRRERRGGWCRSARPDRET